MAALLMETDETSSIPGGSALTSEAPITAPESGHSPLDSAGDDQSTGPLPDSSASEQKSELSEESSSSPAVASPEEPESPPDGREALSKQAELPVAATDLHRSQRDRDRESKILHFSHKVMSMIQLQLVIILIVGNN